MKKILMVLHVYPPCSAIGALRNVKFAKYLPKYGWEPIVITRYWNDETYPLEEPPGIKVFRTKYHDRLGIFRRRNRGNNIKKERINSKFFIQDSKMKKAREDIRSKIAFLINEIFAYPDEQIGWKNFVLLVGRKVIKEERPNVIFSSSSPVTSHIIASQLSKEFHIPWVADFRDLWTQNHYTNHVFVRKIIERRLEKNTLKNADRLLAVSEPLAEKLEFLHNKKAIVITNGFDLDDYSKSPPPLTQFFSTTYTGAIYKGKRDPSHLFAAIKELLEDKIIEEDKFCVRFFGPGGEYIRQLAATYNIQNVIHCEGVVPYKNSIRAQRESTILLLLNWCCLEEEGVYTGKIFEYLGAQRPILAIPKNNGVVDELLMKTNAGVVAGTKEEVKKVLKKWYIYFKENGTLPYKGEKDVIMQYTRERKAKELADVLDNIVKGKMAKKLPKIS